jgi:1-phosphofructokinase
LTRAARGVITVTPNPGLDLTYTLPVSSSHDVDVCRASRSTLEASGKGVNVSRALHAAGMPTCAVLPAGGPTGRYLAELLDDEGVSHRIVPQEGHTRVNTTVLRSGGETVKFNGPGGALSSAEQDALIGVTRLAIEDARPRFEETWVAVCGSLPPGVTPYLVTELVQLTHALGARCAVDASGDALRAALNAHADLVAPNRDELADVIDGGLDATDLRELASVALSLSVDTASRLLISLGRDGALYADGDVVLHATAAPLTPVNTAGAGDALLAGWLFTTADARSRLPEAVRWGRSACLSATTVDSRPGLGDTAPVIVTCLLGEGKDRRARPRSG